MSVEVIIGIIASISAVVFAIVSFLHTRKHDNNEAGRQMGTVMNELGYIKSGVDDIKRKQEKQEEQHVEVISRLSAVETSVHSAHQRIDRLEQKGGVRNG